MSMSLRDQLLQAGLISQKQAKEAERQADRQAEQQRHQHAKHRHQKPKGASQRPATPPAAPTGTTAATAVAPSTPAAAPAPLRPVSPHASAQAAKLARDQALSRKQQEKAQKKALQAQIKQIIEHNRLPQAESDEPYNFVDDGKIRRITMNAANRGALARGEIFIVRHEGRYDLVSATVAARIRERHAAAVVTIAAATESTPVDEAYKGFEVPDDLIW